MLLGRPLNKRKTLVAGIILIGSFGVVKLMQDARYFQRDLQKLSELQLSERDLERVKEKFRLSEKEMEDILKAQKQHRNETVNVIEANPNFQHKRAE